MTRNEIIQGLKSGRKLRCDRRDELLLPWLLNHPQIQNSGVKQAGSQSSYIEFSWREQK